MIKCLIGFDNEKAIAAPQILRAGIDQDISCTVVSDDLEMVGLQ